MELFYLERETDMAEEKEINNRDLVFDAINAERERQIKLEKGKNHSWATWYIIFAKYVGKLGEEFLSIAFNRKSEAYDFYNAIIEVLAVGVAWAEEALERIYGKQKQT